MQTNSHWTVLIVDNEPEILQLVTAMLKLERSTILSASSGEAALTLLNRLTPTLILMDLSMPGMNGWELFTEIRRLPHTRHIPVIALTAHALSGDREKVLEFGFNGYIAKPFYRSDLLREITACLESQSSV